jgi:phosphoglucomutase
MIGDAVRDKDAVVTGAMLCEVAAWAKEKGSTFYEELIAMYAEYGFFREALVSLVKKGKDGAEQISAMMERFRTDTPSEIAGSKVIEMRDYKTGEIKNLVSGETTSTGIPASNVIQFYLEDGSKVTARPSGTEPKIKFYFSLNTEIEGKSDFEESKTRMDARIEELKEAFVNA